ncbi:MAG TPA: DUF3226 domain-containing protein [Bryobacteraceae bacterium]|nr:DUF3226 domain-containing protein [Bryobacteraceae bacterium]
MLYGYLAVEGPTDVEFVGRLLRASGLRRVQNAYEVDDLWRILIPNEYPPGGDLLKRVPVPGFFRSDTHSVAVESAGGLDRLVPAVQDTRSQLFPRWEEVVALGLMADADQETPPDRFQRLRNALQEIGMPVPVSVPGEISDGRPRLGIYVFPDNLRQGTLEDLLGECAAKVYPGLLDGARTFVGGVDRTVLTQEDVEEAAKPSGEIKATLACIAGFLVAGGTLQVSVARNRWLRDDALALDNIAAVHTFLKHLLGLNA